ncbi:VOC family protein [Streptomyces yaizuensis]|uniref:VOC family protein n=1 Tax=Streptomyces yaizuensis TaxID=2989713 RepID=A0ABQ5P9K7_9ACTN|nr:VOC family protein [Streptomyces sp. YSPA8]GLF99274.1 VOC family protein [Streptomyces sp. YSPA8]
MAIAELTAVTLDCPDARRLAAFYQGLLGGEVRTESDNWIELVIDGAPSLGFQQVAAYTPPTWPVGDVPTQVHLDLQVGDLDAAEAGALALGASVLDAGDTTRSWRVYADPAGHPFCLVAHH